METDSINRFAGFCPEGVTRPSWLTEIPRPLTHQVLLLCWPKSLALKWWLSSPFTFLHFLTLTILVKNNPVSLTGDQVKALKVIHVTVSELQQLILFIFPLVPYGTVTATQQASP